MQRITRLAAVAALLFPLLAGALEIKEGAIANRDLFGVQFAGSDSQFYGRADRVLSVSWQEYSVGTHIVSEVTVDFEGSAQQIRIYSLRLPTAADIAAQSGADKIAAASTVVNPLKAAQEKVDAAASIAGGDKINAAPKIPVKTYPVTTHAHTVEYTVGSREELLRFYTALRDRLSKTPARVDAAATLDMPISGEKTVRINPLGGTVFIINP